MSIWLFLKCMYTIKAYPHTHTHTHTSRFRCSYLPTNKRMAFGMIAFELWMLYGRTQDSVRLSSCHGWFFYTSVFRKLKQIIEEKTLQKKMFMQSRTVNLKW